MWPFRRKRSKRSTPEVVADLRAFEISLQPAIAHEALYRKSLANDRTYHVHRGDSRDPTMAILR